MRCEGLNHVTVLNERHLRIIPRDYFEYYYPASAHLSLGRNSPVPRDVDVRTRHPNQGDFASGPQLSSNGIPCRWRVRTLTLHTAGQFPPRTGFSAATGENMDTVATNTPVPVVAAVR